MNAVPARVVALTLQLVLVFAYVSIKRSNPTWLQRREGRVAEVCAYAVYTACMVLPCALDFVACRRDPTPKCTGLVWIWSVVMVLALVTLAGLCVLMVDALWVWQPPPLVIDYRLPPQVVVCRAASPAA